jgi:hypothetical protein
MFSKNLRYGKKIGITNSSRASFNKDTSSTIAALGGSYMYF